jgi:retron-type reverse transcriptase
MMETYKNIFDKICSLENLAVAFKKARKNKSKKFYVLDFESNLEENLLMLQKELIGQVYLPKPLKSFIIRDPKTRKIHASSFVDRIVHHAIIRIVEPIFDKIFIYDSYASRKYKGTHKAIERFRKFMRKVSKNGKLIKNSLNDNMIEGYVLKADIKHYFEEVNHNILIKIIKHKIDDLKVLDLIEKILKNFDSKISGKGMPPGNLTSQFFANVYLNKLDSFVKHELKAKYYIRYVDDFVILHRSKKRLEYFKKRIKEFIERDLKLELHPDKSKILALRNGISFLGYRIFYYYTLLNKKNIRLIEKKVLTFKENKITTKDFKNCLSGWKGYAQWANSFNLEKKLIEGIKMDS